VSEHHEDGALAAQTRHVEALLEAKGLLDAGELDRALEAFLAGASPANGARVAARAWLDDGFRARLLADGTSTVEELGLSMGGGIRNQRLKVVENTEAEHNVIVCLVLGCQRGKVERLSVCDAMSKPCATDSGSSATKKFSSLHMVLLRIGGRTPLEYSTFIVGDTRLHTLIRMAQNQRVTI